MAKVVAIANNKGGVARTTTVLALSHAWSMKGFRVLAVDLDSQANLTTLLSPENFEYERTIRDALVEKKGLPYINVANNFSFVPSSLLLSTIENDIIAYHKREEIFKQLLNEVNNKFDIIIIDCPSSIGLVTYSALLTADALVIPVTTDNLSYKGMAMITELASRIKPYNPKLTLKGVIATKFKADQISNHYLNYIKMSSKTAFIETVIHEATTIKYIATMHTNIYEFAPNEQVTQEYLKVAEEILCRIFDNKTA